MASTTGTNRSGTTPTATRERILRAFLRVVAEHGLDRTTTRAIAEEAGVNEVTLFRHFGDKAGMAVAAIREFSPAADLNSKDPAIDASTPGRAGDGLLAALQYCRAIVHNRPELLSFGIAESRRMPEIAREIAEAPKAVMGFLERALKQAAPALRPEIDPRVVTLQWVGMIVHTSLMLKQQIMPPLSEQEWNLLLTASVRGVIQQGDEWHGQ